VSPRDVASEDFSPHANPHLSRSFPPFGGSSHLRRPVCASPAFSFSLSPPFAHFLRAESLGHTSGKREERRGRKGKDFFARIDPNFDTFALTAPYPFGNRRSSGLLLIIRREMRRTTHPLAAKRINAGQKKKRTFAFPFGSLFFQPHFHASPPFFTPQ